MSNSTTCKGRRWHQNATRGHSGDLENPHLRKGEKHESPLRMESGDNSTSPAMPKWVFGFLKLTRVKGKAGEKEV